MPAAQAELLVQEAATRGFAAVLLTTSKVAPPAPDALDGVWAALDETGLVAVLHFGTTGMTLPRGWRRVADRTDGEAADPIDVVCAHHGAEAIVARLALSGILEGRPGLRVLTAEHGAAWLPGLLTSLDACQRAFRSTDPGIPQDTPLSTQVRRALTVTPFVFERIGELQDQVGDGILAFATDHPHPEGGRDAAGSFSRSLGDRAGAAFFEGNAAGLFDAR